MAKEIKNYVLGRGKLFFSRFKANTQSPAGFLYFGNTPEFNMTIQTDDLDHFSSDEGVKEKDDGITLQVTRTGTFTTDNISADNVALFFFGEADKIVTASAGATTYTIQDVSPGYDYIVGSTDTNPVGVRGINASDFVVSAGGGAAATGTITISAVPAADDTLTVGTTVYTYRAAIGAANDIQLGGSVATTIANTVAAINGGPGAGIAYGAGTAANDKVTVVNNAGVIDVTARVKGTTGNTIALAKTGTAVAVSGATLTGGSATGASYVLDTDYSINLDTGRLSILEGGAINEGDDIDVTYSTRASTSDRILSGTNAIEGALMFEAHNPKGSNKDFYMPYVQLTPNGDYSLKGDDWQAIPFNIAILKPKNNGAAITANGRPVYQ